MNNIVPFISTIYRDTLNCFKSAQRKKLPFFFECLCNACQASPPPYGELWYENLFHNLANNQLWFSKLLIGYSEEESIASKRLQKLRAQAHLCISKFHLSLINQHQKDEARHSFEFLELAELVFPGLYVSEIKSNLRSTYSEPGDPSINEIGYKDLLKEVIYINIGEVKNRIHLKFLKQACQAKCPKSTYGEVTQRGENLIRDEIRHIYFTGLILEDLSAKFDQAEVLDLYKKLFVEFNNELISDFTY